MRFFNEIKSNLYYLLEKAKRNYLMLLIFGGVFLVGFLLGLIFNDNLIFINTNTGELFILNNVGFWGCFFKLLLIYIKTIVVIFALSLINKLYWGSLIIPFFRGAECGISIIKIMRFYSLIGILGTIIVIVSYLLLIFLTFEFFCHIKDNQFSCFIIDKFTLKVRLKHLIKLLIGSIILSFIVALIFCFSVSGLFYFI